MFPIVVQVHLILGVITEIVHFSYSNSYDDYKKTEFISLSYLFASLRSKENNLNSTKINVCENKKFGDAIRQLPLGKWLIALRCERQDLPLDLFEVLKCRYFFHKNRLKISEKQILSGAYKMNDVEC